MAGGGGQAEARRRMKRQRAASRAADDARQREADRAAYLSRTSPPTAAGADVGVVRAEATEQAGREPAEGE
jgi:hypothetical protein